MWSSIVVTYCVFCWLIGFAMTCLWAPQVGERTGLRGLNIFPLQLWAVAISPLVLPLIACQIFLAYLGLNRRRSQLRWALKTVREYEFAKVNSLYLAEPVRRQFERNTPALFQLGFELIGDFRMKPEPVEVHDRIFLHSDGKTMATICALLNSGGESFISVLSDGTSVHTSSSSNPRPNRALEPGDRLSIRYLPELAAEDRYRRHLDAIQEITAASGTSVLVLRPDQFRELMVYDQRIFNRWRYRHGDLPAKPPEPDFKTLAS